MKIISEKEFVKIIVALQSANDLRDSINDLMRGARENVENDFMNAAGLMICHETIVIQLLAAMFGDRGEDISYFINELDYGRKYKAGCVTEVDGNIIDLSTAGKLYAYLVEQENVRVNKNTR